MEKVNIKKLQKEMKRTIKEGFLEDYFVTTEFKQLYREEQQPIHISAVLHMIDCQNGYVRLSENDFCLVRIENKQIVDYFQYMNLRMPDVQGIFLDNERLAFNMTLVDTNRRKKPVLEASPVLQKKLPPYLIGDKIYSDKDSERLYTKQGKDIFDVTDLFTPQAVQDLLYRANDYQLKNDVEQTVFLPTTTFSDYSENHCVLLEY